MSNLKWGATFAVFAFLISVFLGIVFDVAPVFIFLRGIIFAGVFFGLGFGLRFLINSYFPEIFYGDEYGDEQHSGEQGDSGVNSLIYSSGEYALPELIKTSSGTEEIGNIEDLISGVFNQNAGRPQGKSVDGYPEAVYNNNNKEGGGDFSLGLPEEVLYNDGDSYQDNSDRETPEAKPVFTPSFADEGDDGVGGLPDLDMMARAFSSFGGDSAPPMASAPPAAAHSSAPEFVPMSMPEQMMTSAEPEPSGRQYNKGNKPETLKGDFKPKEIAEGIRSVLSKDK